MNIRQQLFKKTDKMSTRSNYLLGFGTGTALGALLASPDRFPWMAWGVGLVVIVIAIVTDKK